VTPRSYRPATHPPEEAQIVNVRGQDVRLPTTIVGSYPRPQFLRRKVFPIGGVNSPEFGLRALRPGKYGR
jgi:hypothetical protein